MGGMPFFWSDDARDDRSFFEQRIESKVRDESNPQKTLTLTLTVWLPPSDAHFFRNIMIHDASLYFITENNR